jgi:hypothetical protein
MMVARFAVARPGSPGVSIGADAANVNLRTLANAAGYSSGDCTIGIPAGVEVYSATAGSPAVTVGSWPAGVNVTLINQGTISGAGGAGGNGYVISTAAPTAGQAGGTALDASAATAFTFRLDNAGGTIRGGGGGGAGCGGGYIADFGLGPGYFAGGGGGGGKGRMGGGAGNAGYFDTFGNLPFPGTPGSPSSAGTGGAASTDGVNYAIGYRGGDGGDWGSAGGAPSGATTGDPNFDGPQIGGAAGKSINGHSLVTVLAAGTLIGPTAG